MVEFQISILTCSPETWFCDFCREKFRDSSQNMFIVKFQNRTNLFAANNLQFVDSSVLYKKLNCFFIYDKNVNCENSIFFGTEWVNHCCHICKHFSKSFEKVPAFRNKNFVVTQTSKSSILLERHFFPSQIWSHLVVGNSSKECYCLCCAKNC